MPKTKISEFDVDPANNTDINSINIAEGCAPSGINNAIRQLMSDLKEFQTGGGGDSITAVGVFSDTVGEKTSAAGVTVDGVLLKDGIVSAPVNGTVGATTPSTGAFTTLSASSTLTVTGAGSIQGLTVGRGAGAISSNTAVGASALGANTTGANNTAVGYQSLQANTTASNNTAVGYQASYTGTTGTQNTALGYRALYTNNTNNATALGYLAAYTNASGSEILAVGNEALYSNTTGSGNTALGGYRTLFSNTTGANNTAVGMQALQANTTASNNTAIGQYSRALVTTGTGNVLVGQATGSAITTGTNNAFIGFNSGAGVTTGSKNSILGAYSGNQGGLDIRTASNYIVLSDGDGNPRGIFDSSGNLLVGTTTNTASARLNVIPSGTCGINTKVVTNGDLGCNFQNASANQVGYIQVNASSTTYSTASDYRLKENIAPMTGALAKVAQLKPVTYTWKSTGEADEGFIAHELQEVCPSAVSGEKDAVDSEGNIKAQGIDTSFLVATLTAAIQEMKQIIDAQAERITALENK
jgi:hypothetical protein